MGTIVYNKEKGEPIFICEYLTFDMYFASLAAMRYHPGSGTKDHVMPTLEDCRDTAMEMLKLRRALPVFEPAAINETVKVPTGDTNE